MIFLNPLILLALTAIAVPILIHLFSLRKVRKVEFSTLMFVKEIQKSKLRRIKLKQLLLLFFRIMMIVFLVLAFANPIYEGYTGDEGSVRKKAVIFIDDSFSMNRKDENGLYFEQVKKTFEDVLKLFKETDEVYVVPSSVITMKEKKVLYNDFKEIIDSISKANTSYKSLSVNEILNYTNELFEKSSGLINEVYIISDFQKTNFESELPTPLELENISDKVQLYLVNIGQRDANNISIDDVKVQSRIIEKGKRIKLKAYITNHSKYNVFNKTVSLVIEDEVVSESVVDIGSLETKEIDLDFRPGASGNVGGYVQLLQSEFIDDEISEDNKFYFTIYVPAIFNVCIVEDDPADSRFIRLALETAKKIISDLSSSEDALFNISQVRGVTKSIYNYDMIFIISKRSFSQSESEIIKEYLNNGGGVFIFPGRSIDVNNYNNALLNSINAFRIGGPFYNVQDEQGISQLKFERIDYEHPVLSEIFQNERLSITKDDFNIESPDIKSYYEILLNEVSISIITLSNKKNFLVESKSSNGKLLFCAVSSTTDMSDLPLRSIFAPLIVRSVYYLGGDPKGEIQYTLGRRNIIPVKDLNNITNLLLPEGSKISFDVSLKEDRENTDESEKSFEGEEYVSLPYSYNTNVSGLYTFLDLNTNERYSFALNSEKRESDLQKANVDDVINYFKEKGFQNVTYIKNPFELEASVKQERRGIELWKYFLLAAIAFLLLELYYSRKLERT